MPWWVDRFLQGSWRPQSVGWPPCATRPRSSTSPTPPRRWISTAVPSASSRASARPTPPTRRSAATAPAWPSPRTRWLHRPRARDAPAGFEVWLETDDVPGAYARAVEAGAESVAEPTEKPWGQTVAGCPRASPPRIAKGARASAVARRQERAVLARPTLGLRSSADRSRRAPQSRPRWQRADRPAGHGRRSPRAGQQLGHLVARRGAGDGRRKADVTPRAGGRTAARSPLARRLWRRREYQRRAQTAYTVPETATLSVPTTWPFHPIGVPKPGVGALTRGNAWFPVLTPPPTATSPL